MSVLGQWSGSMSISLSVRRFSWMSGSGSGSIPVSYLVHCLCVCLHVFVTSLSLFFCICVSASVLYACSVLLTYFCLFLSPIGFLFAFQPTGFCLSGWRWRPACSSLVIICAFSLGNLMKMETGFWQLGLLVLLSCVWMSVSTCLSVPIFMWLVGS